MFEIKPELEDLRISRSELIGAIKFQLKTVYVSNNGNFKAEPWLIILEDNFGLIRCTHLDKDRTMELLENITQIRRRVNEQRLNEGLANGSRAPQQNHENIIRIEVKTLGTTGTIKSAKKKYLNKYIKVKN